MKAVAVSPSTKQVGPVDLEEPVLRGPTEVRVHILEVGIPGLHGPKPVDIDGLMRALVLKNQLARGTLNAHRPACETAIAHLARFRRQVPEAVGGLISKRRQIADHAGLLPGRSGGIQNVISLEQGASQ